MADTPKERHTKHEARFEALEATVSENTAWIWGPDKAPEMGAQSRLSKLERAYSRRSNVFLQYVLGPLLMSLVAGIALVVAEALK